MQSKSELAYTRIRERIASQEFPPGTRLVLAQLAELLGMSVVPVREAIRRLEAEGTVVFEKNVGARVALMSAERYSDAMQALAIVEGAATALAAELLPPERICEARTLNARIEAMLDGFDSAQFAQLNREFHHLLTLDCPNDDLNEMVRDGWDKLQMVRDPATIFTRERAAASVAEHAHILQLIETRASAAEIETAVREHRLATREAVLGATETSSRSASPHSTR